MNSYTVTQRLSFVWLLASWGASACRDSTPIGLVECIGERIECGVSLGTDPHMPPQPVETPHDEIASTGLDTLMPVWSGHPFEDSSSGDQHLLVDANGALWSLTVPDGRVKLAKLDREGAALEEHTIEPPVGSRDPDGLFAVPRGISPPGPNSSATVALFWTRMCDGRSGEPSDCSFNELLVFDAFEDAPRRINLGFQDAWQTQANASGVWLLQYGLPPHIDKRDLSGDLIWRQTGQLDIQPQDSWWQVRGTLHPSDECGALLWLNPN